MRQVPDLEPRRLSEPPSLLAPWRFSLADCARPFCVRVDPFSELLEPEPEPRQVRQVFRARGSRRQSARRPPGFVRPGRLLAPRLLRPRLQCSWFIKPRTSLFSRMRFLFSVPRLLFPDVQRDRRRLFFSEPCSLDFEVRTLDRICPLLKAFDRNLHNPFFSPSKFFIRQASRVSKRSQKLSRTFEFL